MPSSVMIALVAGGTLNSSAANFSTAVKGVFSGTERLKGDSLDIRWDVVRMRRNSQLTLYRAALNLTSMLF